MHVYIYSNALNKGSYVCNQLAFFLIKNNRIHTVNNNNNSDNNKIIIIKSQAQNHFRKFLTSIISMISFFW